MIIFKNLWKNLKKKINENIKFEFNPQNYFISEDLKDVKLNNNKIIQDDKKKDNKLPEENNISYTYRLIPQAIGYGTLFTILFFLKKK